MPVLGQIEEARQEGYSDDEIMSYLSQLPDYSDNINTAISEGYGSSEILSYYESPDYLSSIEEPVEEFTNAFPEAQIISDNLSQEQIVKEKSFAQKALGFLKEKFTFSPEQEAKFGELVESAGLKPFDKEFQEVVAKTPETDPIREASKEVWERLKKVNPQTFNELQRVLPRYELKPEQLLQESNDNFIEAFEPIFKVLEPKKEDSLGKRLGKEVALFAILPPIITVSLLDDPVKTTKGIGLFFLTVINDWIEAVKSPTNPTYNPLKSAKAREEIIRTPLFHIVPLLGIGGALKVKIGKFSPKNAKTLSENLAKDAVKEAQKNPEVVKNLSKPFSDITEVSKTRAEQALKIAESERKATVPDPKIVEKERIEALSEEVTPKPIETPAEAKVAQEKAIIEPDVTTRKATYTVQEDGKIIKKAKGVETEVTKKELDEVLEQQEFGKKNREAHALEKEKGIVGEEAKKIKQDMFGVESLATLSSNDVKKYIDVIKKKEDVKTQVVSMPKDFIDITKIWTDGIEKLEIKDIDILKESVKIAKTEKAPFLGQLQERLDVVSKERTKLIEGAQTKHGETELIVTKLKEKGLTNKDIDSIVLEDGTKLVNTVKIKREKNGVLSAVITKDQMQSIKDSYSKERPVDKWVDISKKDVPRTLKGEIKRLYELPQIIFKTNKLDKILYDPIRLAERNARDLKTEIYNKFQKKGLFKEGNAVLADRFTLSKHERENIGKYYLDRQGKRTGITFDKLSPRSKKFVEVFDSITKEYKDKIYEVARLNGIELGRVENYAPLMVSTDLKLTENMGLMDFITRKQPAFFSTKERIEKVPIEMYEKNYARVATIWIDKMADFITVGEQLPQTKYLVDYLAPPKKPTKGSNILTDWDKKYIQDWVKTIATPKTEQKWLQLAKHPRKWTSISALGLNPIPVIKQALTQIPVTFIEGARPKWKSQFAKDFNIEVKSLPSIKERKGNVSIQDMQEGFGRMMVGSLTQFDKYNARLSLNSLLDKSYRKYKKKGLPVDSKMKDLVLKEAQDKLDLWYGGMTKSQMPEAFRTEGGKLLNMFIYPLTSQLNGFYYEIAKARGFGNKSIAVAQTLAVATAIAYTEVVLSKMSFKWDDKEDMAQDIFNSLAGNAPILGNIVYSFANDKAYSPSPVINSLDAVRRKSNKFKDDPESLDELMFAAAEFFGIPKQFRKIYEGVEFIKEEGFRDKKGKLLAPALKGDRLRAVIRGKYGTLAVQEYLDNLGEKTENRKWTYPEVEFLQNGDYDRKAAIYKKLDPKTKKFLYNELSEFQKKELKDHL